VKAIKVYQGDILTVELADGTVDKVRLIGVDAPELHDDVLEVPFGVFGKAARDYLDDLIANEEITLIPGAKERDNYGRILAYVYKGERCVNFEMVRIGYAYAYTVALDADDADLFLEAEREAREAGRGLWADNR
jgi:micrococcal nuclease